MSCCRAAHQFTPFHRLEYWTSTHYARAHMHDTGLIIQLGHGGHPCGAHGWHSSAPSFWPVWPSDAFSTPNPSGAAPSSAMSDDESSTEDEQSNHPLSSPTCLDAAGSNFDIPPASSSPTLSSPRGSLATPWDDTLPPSSPPSPSQSQASSRFGSPLRMAGDEPLSSSARSGDSADMRSCTEESSAIQARGKKRAAEDPFDDEPGSSGVIRPEPALPNFDEDEDGGDGDDEDDSDSDAEQDVYHVSGPEAAHMPSNREECFEADGPPSGRHNSRTYSTNAPFIMVIVDISGVHEIPVRLCSCPNAKPADEQLLHMGLYPATSRRPRTAFTFALLDDALLTNKECKTSIMNYFNKIRRLTNDVFSHAVPVSSNRAPIGQVLT